MIGKPAQTSVSSEIPSKSRCCTKGTYFRVHLSVGMGTRLPAPVTAAAKLESGKERLSEGPIMVLFP